MLIALGDRGSKYKNVETRMAQFARKSYAQFRVFIEGRLPHFWENKLGPSRYINQAISELLLDISYLRK